MTHDEFMHRAQAISDGAVTVLPPDPEPEDRAALEAEMADLRKQRARLEREITERHRTTGFGPPDEVEREHRDTMQRLHYRIERLKHRTDFLRWQERQSGNEKAAAAQQAAPTDERSYDDRLEALEADVKQIKAVMVRMLGCHELA